MMMDDALLTELVDVPPEILVGDVMIRTHQVPPSNGDIQSWCRLSRGVGI
jgi:hypothetical protein